MFDNGIISATEKSGVRPDGCRTAAHLTKAAENAAPTIVCIYVLLCALPFETDFALFVLAGATICLAVIVRPRGMVRASRPDLVISLFLAVQALAVCSSTDPRASLLLSAPLLPAILVYYLLSTHTSGAASLRLVFLSFSLLAMVLASSALLTAWRVPWTSTYRWAARLGSPLIVVPNDFTFHSLVLPLSAVFLRPRYGRVQRSTAALSITASLAAITVLRSRIALLAAFLSLALFAALRRPKLVLASVASLLVIFLVTDALFGFTLLGKFVHSGNDEGVTGRISLWSAAWEAFLDSPWTGQGPHTFVFAEVRWVHNLYLEALAEQGILGLLALLILLGCGLRCAWCVYRSGREDVADLGGAAFAALAVFCFAALFELTFLRQWVPLILFTLLGSSALLHSTGGGFAAAPVPSGEAGQ